jgi:prepilin signal peptidase PulO-like enzyme (type II secretory pathway)
MDIQLHLAMYRVSFVCLLCLVISVIDVKTYTIPDVLLLILGAGLLVWDIFNSNRFMILSSTISALALFCVFFAVFHFAGGLGFGDVKFAALIGYALGFQKAVLACLFASLAGIIFFGVVFIITKQGKCERCRKKIPFAPFLSSGFCSVLGAQTLGVL